MWCMLALCADRTWFTAVNELVGRSLTTHFQISVPRAAVVVMGIWNPSPSAGGGRAPPPPPPPPPVLPVLPPPSAEQEAQARTTAAAIRTNNRPRATGSSRVVIAR